MNIDLNLPFQDIKKLLINSLPIRYSNFDMDLVGDKEIIDFRVVKESEDEIVIFLLDRDNTVFAFIQLSDLENGITRIELNRSSGYSGPLYYWDTAAKFLISFSEEDLGDKAQLNDKEIELDSDGLMTIEAKPKWWPKTISKKLRWKSLYKKIRPLHDRGLNNTEIGNKLGIRRQDIPHILLWAKEDPKAHN